ncbi:GatB/YqeY domain-containing protein [Irregularibacter muris]|uniref:GatB/YqeY domain-containing protein n=1 Tax=Irregularibacter muris TaxID=1796619 RepID=A0AAE3HEV0_9FIRM|nr:GatB/YqeY domain-containing protein [Irregularibacter muris]MCR1897853.1 GatB/YqeY domain-containing protein [Irregularibacter muris]
MSLKERLLADLKQSMKEKDAIRKSTITMVRAAILQVEKDNKVELDDEEIIGVIAKQAKQRKDAIKEFKMADRQDLVEQNNREVEILSAYLPQQLSEEEVDQIVADTILEVGANSMKDMGRVMSAIMPKVKGRADGALINKFVKQHLQG